MVEDIDASIIANVGNTIAIIFRPLGFGNWQSAVATVPVSYTHLDVYKRQNRQQW